MHMHTRLERWYEYDRQKLRVKTIVLARCDIFRVPIERHLAYSDNLRTSNNTTMAHQGFQNPCSRTPNLSTSPHNRQSTHPRFSPHQTNPADLSTPTNEYHIQQGKPPTSTGRSDAPSDFPLPSPKKNQKVTRSSTAHCPQGSHMTKYLTENDVLVVVVALFMIHRNKRSIRK